MVGKDGRLSQAVLVNTHFHGVAARLDNRPNPSVCQFHHEKDRKSTRLNSSHVSISYAVFCLKKKNKNRDTALYKGTLESTTIVLVTTASAASPCIHTREPRLEQENTPDIKPNIVNAEAHSDL